MGEFVGGLHLLTWIQKQGGYIVLPGADQWADKRVIETNDDFLALTAEWLEAMKADAIRRAGTLEGEDGR
jgi:hypothetical protein